MVWLMIIGIFIVSFCLVLAMLKSITKRDLYLQRLKQATTTSETVKSPKNKRLTTSSLVASLARLVAPRSVSKKVQSELVKAGIPLKAQEYLVLTFGLIFVVPLLVFIVTQNTWLALAMVVLGVFLPRFYVKNKKEKRISTINQQLGDTLIIMANALRAGFGFQQSMDTVRREMPAPISSEFAWTLREINLGVSQEEALLNLGQRVGSDDLDMVITGIIIQRQVGGNLAEILENIAQTIRDRDKIKRNIKVLTAQGRLSGIIIGFLPVALVIFMLVINPAYFSIMFEKSLGIGMLVGAGLMEIIGVVVIRKMVNFEY